MIKNNLNQLIIIGGGTSIAEGINRGLWDRLKYKFSIGCNYSYNFFESTIQTFVDSTFYNDNVENLKNLSLIIGQGKNLKKKLDNTIIIPCSSAYNRNLSGGIYRASLTGVYSLSLAIYLLDIGEIFILGFDYSAIGKDEKNRNKTHFYQGQVEHRGIGKSNWYDLEGRADKEFGVYKEESKIKIWNVSLESRINTFPKISYNEFFEKLDNYLYDQETLRTWIKERLKGKYI